MKTNKQNKTKHLLKRRRPYCILYETGTVWNVFHFLKLSVVIKKKVEKQKKQKKKMIIFSVSLILHSDDVRVR